MTEEESDKRFEIGITYSYKGKFFIAISQDTLATYEGGRFVTRKNMKNLRARRGMAVESLCSQWNITTDKLDELSKQYFTPVLCKDRDIAEKERTRSPIPLLLTRRLRAPSF